MNEVNNVQMSHIIKQLNGESPVIPQSRSWVQAQMIRERFGFGKTKANPKRKDRGLKRRRKKV